LEKKPITFITRDGLEAVEDVDFYVENTYYVFTAHYLLRRGFCCQSGCRHCPYGFNDKKKKSTD